MSILNIAFPAQAAFQDAAVFAGTAASIARPVLRFSALAAVLMIFKPMLIGILRAVALVVKPRRPVEERTGERSLRDAMALNHLAQEYEMNHPGLAAELRSIAARDC